MKKLVIGGVVAIALFYLVTAPHTAASAVKATGTNLQHVAHQVSLFLKALV